MPSAAEPTHPGPADHPPTGAHTDTNVIHLAKRGLRRGRRHPTPTAAPDQPVTPQQQLAETVEAAFLRRGRTLTDPATAEAYAITLQLVHLMHEGAMATSVITQGEHDALHGMISGMVDAPHEL